MKITGITATTITMPLQEAYTIAYETVTTATNVLIRIETSSHHTGYGCSAPDEPVTGETPASVLEGIEAARELIVGSDPLRVAHLVERLKTELGGKPSTIAGIDMALHDIMGKVAGQPLWKLLGGYRRSFKTSITIGVSSVEQTVAEARERVGAGFSVLKIKGGVDVEQDVERLFRVREAVGDKVELRFDANQGYSVPESLRFVEATRQVHLELIEQPTPRTDSEQLGMVTQNVPLPIMADESLMNLRDAFRLARKDLVDMINIKLMKVGGIYEAQMVNAVARAARLEAMVGCMDESALAIAAGPALCARPAQCRVLRPRRSPRPVGRPVCRRRDLAQRRVVPNERAGARFRSGCLLVC